MSLTKYVDDRVGDGKDAALSVERLARVSAFIGLARLSDRQNTVACDDTWLSRQIRRGLYDGRGTWWLANSPPVEAPHN